MIPASVFHSIACGVYPGLVEGSHAGVSVIPCLPAGRYLAQGLFGFIFQHTGKPIVACRNVNIGRYPLQ